MHNTVLEQFFTFTTFIEKLKLIERYKGQYYWRDYAELPRYDSVAEHTWRMAVMVMLFQDQLSQKINLEKAIKMALIHDLPEVIAGDAHPMGEDGTGKDTYATHEDLHKEKVQNERLAAKELFAKLPEKTGAELYNLWEEYERMDCYEAKLVKAIDRIETLFQVLEYRRGKEMYKKHWEFGNGYTLKWCEFDPFVKEFAELVIKKYKTEVKFI